MRQIAEKAGVNRSTVSLALRDDPRLKMETRQKIQDLAKEMGYQQNPTVAHLMTQLRAGQQKHFRSNIAVLDFGPLGAVERQIWIGAQQRAKMLGYGLEFFHVRDFGPPRLEQILVNRGIQGLIISPLWGITTLPPEFDHLWTKFSCCCVGIHPNNPELNFVGDDNYSTSRMAVEKLAQLGFSRIGLAIHSGINIETEYRFVGGYLTSHLADPELEQTEMRFCRGFAESSHRSSSVFKRRF
jgi:DNA-binding LacI/PurR family transcriptional regulator